MLASLKQERFVSEYLIDLNATQAAIRSGFAANSARVTASRLLSKANILKAIQIKRVETEKRLQIQRDDVIKGLLQAAKEAKQQSDPTAMIAAYREIGRMLGYYDQQQVSSESIEELSVAEIQEMPESELLKTCHADQSEISVDEASEWIVT